MAYPSLYRAKAIQFDGTTLTAYVPQVFGDVTIEIRDFIGDVVPGMGWVMFQAGNPEFPVWMSGFVLGGDTPVPTFDDEVWVGASPPPGNEELWYNTTDGKLYANVNGSWVVVSTGGGSTGIDEVWIGPDTPAELQELWYDTDEPGSPINHWNTAWGVVGRGAFVGGNPVTVPASANAQVGSMVANAVSGRRYRVNIFANAYCGTGASNAGYFMLSVDGVQRSEGTWNLAVSAYGHARSEWVIENLTTGTHTFSFIFYNQSTNAALLYNDGGYVTLEDRGPVTIAALEPPAAQTPVVASGNALGIVALGTAGYVEATAAVPAAGVTIGAPITFTFLTGRRYRISQRIPSMYVISGPACGVQLHVVDIANAQVGDGDQWLWVGGSYSGAVLQTLLNGDGNAKTFRAVVSTVNATAGTKVGLWNLPLTVEDMGPNQIPALPIPATPPPWTAVTTYQNGWHAYTADTTYQPLRYRKVGDEYMVEGALAGGTLDVVAFTLPQGPPKHLAFFGVDNVGKPASMEVWSTGVVYVYVGTGTPPDATYISVMFRYSVTP